MSLFAILLVFFFLIIVIAQFGSRLAARNSILWWAVAVFIIVAAVQPSLLQPLVTLMGIQVVSNFVLASLVMFLFFQLLEITGETTLQSRKLRQLVSNFAADHFLNRLKTAPSFKSSTHLRVLVVLPCYNEEKALPDTISRILKLLENRDNLCLDIQVCFIDDGSKDSSRMILQKLIPDSFTSHAINIGVAGVLLTGFSIALRLDVDYVVQCDADGQHPIDSIPMLVKTAHDHSYDLLVGSRFCNQNTKLSHASTTLSRATGIAIIREMLKLFGRRARVLDPTSGFRVYSRSAQSILMSMMPDEYPEPESVAILAQHHVKLGEISVHMSPRTTGVSSIQGLNSAKFMFKVITALVGLRLRTIFNLKLG